MKKYYILSLVFTFLIGFGANVYAVPTGAEYSVDELNDPLVLSFTGLTGSLSFDYFFETDWSGGNWDVAIFKDTIAGPEIDRLYILADSSAWTNYTITDSALTGAADLVVYVDDYGDIDNPAAYFKSFSATPTYINGGQQLNSVPEPASMLLFGTGLVGLVGARRKKKA